MKDPLRVVRHSGATVVALPRTEDHRVALPPVDSRVVVQFETALKGHGFRGCGNSLSHLILGAQRFSAAIKALF
jgi:hypothetical protein